MDDLSERMRAAVGTAPPTRIDVEELISADARRRRHRAWTVAGTGVAVAVAAVLVVPPLLASSVGRPGPVTAVPGPTASASPTTPPLCDSVTPRASGPQPPLQSHDTVRPRPTEAPAEAAGRLSAALRAVLATQVPDGVTVESVQPGCSSPQFQYHPSYREYEAGGELRRGEESGWFMVRVAPRPAGEEAGCRPRQKPPACQVVRHPDGSVATVEELPVDGDVRQLSVWVQRADGTLVYLVTSNGRVTPVDNKPVTTRTADEPLLTIDQMVVIGRAPGLTLYP